MSAQPVEVQADELSDQESALRRAAVDVEAKRQVYNASIELRDRLVLELYDAGVHVRRVAKVALMSYPRVLQIVARHG